MINLYMSVPNIYNNNILFLNTIFFKILFQNSNLILIHLLAVTMSD